MQNADHSRLATSKTITVAVPSPNNIQHCKYSNYVVLRIWLASAEGPLQISTWVTGELFTDQPRNIGRSGAVIILVVQHQAAGVKLLDAESAY